MKFVFAPDSFKGTLTSQRQIEILKEKAQEMFPGVETLGIPIADGGEGTIDAVACTVKGRRKKLTVQGPLGKPVEAEYLILDEKRVLIEMAQASGITLLPYCPGNALYTTTYGTGELIRDALEGGYREITISIGGSATNDGGMGMLSALGIAFLDKQGKVLDGKGENLGRIDRIDTTSLIPEIEAAQFCVMCDVSNPLLGENGATYVFGPQKGAGEEDLQLLEKGMEHYAGILQEYAGFDVGACPGAGAAGGMGAALMAFCKARLQSGIQTVLELVAFEELIQDAQLIITGEGRIDGQSACGKVLDGIGTCARKKGIPVAAITGGMAKGAEKIYQRGIGGIMVTEDGPLSLKEALERAEELYAGAAERLFRLIKLGMEIKTC